MTPQGRQGGPSSEGDDARRRPPSASGQQWRVQPPGGGPAPPAARRAAPSLAADLAWIVGWPACCFTGSGRARRTARRGDPSEGSGGRSGSFKNSGLAPGRASQSGGLRHDASASSSPRSQSSAAPRPSSAVCTVTNGSELVGMTQQGMGGTGQQQRLAPGHRRRGPSRKASRTATASPRRPTRIRSSSASARRSPGRAAP